MAQQTKRARTASKGSANRSRTSRNRNGRSASPASRAGSSSGGGIPDGLKASAIAGGAAAAGLIGGLALARKGSVLGVSVPGGRHSVSKNLADAAEQLGGFGDRVGHLANEVRLMREGAARDVKRSPIEVVLQSLTARRNGR